MSRRDDYGRDRYDDRDRDYRPRPRRNADYDEVDIDIRRERSRGPEKRAETVVLERRDDRRERNHDFLREDYGRPTETQQLVIREERRDDDRSSRVSRRRSPPRVKEEEIIIREKERDRPQRPPYPASDIGRGDREVIREEVVYRDSPRRRSPERGPPPGRGAREEIDITIRRREDDDDDARSVLPPRSEIREDTRSRDGRRAPTIILDREEIDIRERRRASPSRSTVRGREEKSEEIDIRIRESDRLEQPPRPRSRSRGQMVAVKEEEWVVRRPRREPSPPPRDYEKEEIIIRRRERSPSPEPPPREPTPEPVPVLEPIVRPPIVQEIITHYRNIDHGFERVRDPSPSPSPPPVAPREREEDLEIAIRRTGVRNGKPYDDELIIERDEKERQSERLVAPPARRRSPSRSGYERDFVAREVDYSTRRPAVSSPTQARGGEERVEETRIDVRRTTIDDRAARVKDRMWTEVAKDLVIKEAIVESGYDYEETEEFYYVMEYLRYVRLATLSMSNADSPDRKMLFALSSLQTTSADSVESAFERYSWSEKSLKEHQR